MTGHQDLVACPNKQWFITTNYPANQDTTTEEIAVSRFVEEGEDFGLRNNLNADERHDLGELLIRARTGSLKPYNDVLRTLGNLPSEDYTAKDPFNRFGSHEPLPSDGAR